MYETTTPTIHEGFCSLTVGSLGFAAEFVSF